MSYSLFTQVPRNLRDIISEIENGKLGLPELQRGYVWKATKVRDLLDSMMKGYPIGYLMIWDSSSEEHKVKQIGIDSKAFLSPKSLIIDGQQRITSLYAVMRKKLVIDHNFREIFITISYNPFTKVFEVADNSKKNSAEWIYDISEVFLNEEKAFRFITEFIENVKEAREKNGLTLSEDEEEIIQQNITGLLSLGNYSIPTLEISSNANEESVADIFVRVNSGGEKLGEDDFILTLISVYWPEGRKKIEEFCKSSRIPKPKTAYNFLFEPSPTHIVRIAMGYGFLRARLHYAYLLLRGRDFETEEFSDELRFIQFETLKKVLDQILNLEVWHGFLRSIEASGFISKTLISSQNALVYSYIFYLIGHFKYSMKEEELRKIISKWFFMVSTTGYYSNSPESAMESDLADLRTISTGEEFILVLENKINAVFTNDYFKVTLPNNLLSSASRNPGWLAYCASLNNLDAKVLFSQLHTRDLFSPGASGTKSALEKHHLFPKAYLKRIGIENDRDRNQIANFAYIEWRENLEILDIPPSEYMIDRPNLDENEKIIAYKNHALPDNWENMDYFDFLAQRRELIASIILDGFKKLK